MVWAVGVPGGWHLGCQLALYGQVQAASLPFRVGGGVVIIKLNANLSSTGTGLANWNWAWQYSLISQPAFDRRWAFEFNDRIHTINITIRQYFKMYRKLFIMFLPHIQLLTLFHKFLDHTIIRQLLLLSHWLIYEAMRQLPWIFNQYEIRKSCTINLSQLYCQTQPAF